MNIFTQLIFNPAITSLLIGFFTGIFTNFSLPRKLMEYISIYLIFTIGFKGGACLGVANQCTPWLLGLALVGVFIGFIQPFINYIILKKTTSLNKSNIVVIASQYGSISIVTFVTAVSFLNKSNIPYDTFMSAIAGMMEIPALFSGLLILKQKNTFNGKTFKPITNICKSILLCNTIISIFIGFFIGVIFGYFPVYAVDHIIIAPFNIMLIFFMIDIGIKIAKQRTFISQIKPSLLAFAIYMPVISGIFAIIIASKIVNYPGSLVLFAILIASASYIAVPAVMRSQAKDATEAIYMTLALGVTLPFNILIGIPLFYYIAQLII